MPPRPNCLDHLVAARGWSGPPRGVQTAQRTISRPGIRNSIRPQLPRRTPCRPRQGLRQVPAGWSPQARSRPNCRWVQPEFVPPSLQRRRSKRWDGGPGPQRGRRATSRRGSRGSRDLVPHHQRRPPATAARRGLGWGSIPKAGPNLHLKSVQQSGAVPRDLRARSISKTLRSGDTSGCSGRVSHRPVESLVSTSDTRSTPSELQSQAVEVHEPIGSIIGGEAVYLVSFQPSLT